MNTALFVLVPLLVGGVVLAFYMDWLGLWVSKEEMREQIARSKERPQGLAKENGAKARETGDVANDDIGTGTTDKAVTFDLDAASLISLREALPGWEMEVINGAAATFPPRDWNPGEVDLLVVKAREDVTTTIALCRVLGRRGVFSRKNGKELPDTLGPRGSLQTHAQRAHAPLLVLLAPGQESFIPAVLEAGAHSCLMRPINAKEVASMLGHAHTGNQPGRHTLNLERAQGEDRWRDDGGQG